MYRRRPSLFIGSSAEGLPVARAVKQELEHDALVTVWNQGFVQLSVPIIDSLLELLNKSMYGVFVFTPDDLIRIRGTELHSVRDNVLFELGLFVGRLGKERSYILLPRGEQDFRIPTDLIGFTPAYYEADRRDSIQAGVGSACNEIRDNVRRSEISLFNSAGGVNSRVLQKTNIENVFNTFYQDAFRERKPHYDVFLCGGNLFLSFEPKHHRIGKSFESDDIKEDIESLSLLGHLFKHLPPATTINLRVLLLNPHNEQINTIEKHRDKVAESTKGSISEKVYGTLYILDKIRHNPRIRDVDVRVTMSPIPFHANWVEHSIFVNQYLLGMRSLDSPFAVYRQGQDLLFDVYATHLTDFFREQFDSVEVDFDRISGKGDVTYDYDLFKNLFDIYLGRKDAFPGESRNPFATQKKLLSNYYDVVVRAWKGETTYPVQLEVNLTDLCNQSCPWCISENIIDVPPQKLDVNEKFRNFLLDFRKHEGKCMAWSGGGEPTTHPEFVKALEYAREADLRQGLLTNGDYDSSLNEHIGEHVDWVRFSVDTHRPDGYEKMRRPRRNSSFERVRHNIEQLTRYRSVRVGLNANISYWNLGDLEGLYQLAQDTKASYLQVRPVLPRPMGENEGSRVLKKSEINRLYLRLVRLKEQTRHEDSPDLIVSYDKFEDLKLWDGEKEDPHTDITTYRGCASHNLFVVLNCDGALSVCMYHLFNDDFVFGNIYEQTYEEIWRNDNRRRQAVVNRCRILDHGKAGCQVCCKGHEMNKILLAMESPQPKGQASRDGFL